MTLGDQTFKLFNILTPSRVTKSDGKNLLKEDKFYTQVSKFLVHNSG